MWLNNYLTEFFLILNYKNKYKGLFEYNYNQELLSNSIVDIIKNQIKNSKNSKVSYIEFEDIINSNNYLLLIINSFGLIIKKLENNNENIYNIIKPTFRYVSTHILINHLCIYKTPNYKNTEQLENILAIHYVSKDLLKDIIGKNFDNYYEQYVNIPALIINKNLTEFNDLIDIIKNEFIIYFDMKDIDKKDLNFSIYFINNIDILGLEMTNLTYIEINELNFILYIMTIEEKENKKIHYYRILVGY